jgi:hypothetical protein
VSLFSTSYIHPARDEEVTARLETVTNVIRMWDDDQHARLKSVNITWELINGHVVPHLDVEFFEKVPTSE